MKPDQKIPVVATVDAETYGILPRPEYPPKPVGVSIIKPGGKPKYYAWGHATRNNCTKADAKRALLEVYDKHPIVFHHGKFDMDVLSTDLEVPLIPKHGYHDTEFLAFLDNPHNNHLKLKPLAEEYLDMPSDERDELRDWILANVEGTHDHKKSKKEPHMFWAAHIDKAPGDLTGKYANGDTLRTDKLFYKLYKKVVIERGMRAAYERELRLMPILLQNERQGVRIDLDLMHRDFDAWKKGIDDVENWLRKKIGVKELDFAKATQLADALENNDFIDDWVYTEKWNRSVSKENLPKAINTPEIINVLSYRSKLVNACNNFATPWLKMADRTGGLIHCDWNQTRNANTTDAGARTGRIQSRPNFQNIVKKTQPLWFPGEPKIDPKKKPLPMPKALRGKIPPIPRLRQYILPDSKKHAIGHRDYSQQELRILAHFEDGILLEQYLENPRMDFHAFATQEINALLRSDYDRDLHIKTVGFGMIYGLGIAKLALKMGLEKPGARLVKNTYLRIFPGLKDLIDDLKFRAQADEPFRTWGGREYYCEPPSYSKKFKRMQTFEYKMLNYLIQGSAADCTKEAIIRVHEACKHSRLLLTVHDEINNSIPRELFFKEMRLMREVMESIEFDVPMLTDGKISLTNWADVRLFTPDEIKKHKV